MAIAKMYHDNTSAFGMGITGKLTVSEIEEFLPEMETAVAESKNKLRLLIDVQEMDSANMKSEWEIFEFLKHHVKDIEYIAIVGAHSWTKVMSEILADSVFIMAETNSAVNRPTLKD